jgi:hypothetical protein
MSLVIETPSRIEPCLLDQMSLAIVDLHKAGMAIDTAVAAADKASVA